MKYGHNISLLSQLLGITIMLIPINHHNWNPTQHTAGKLTLNESRKKCILQPTVYTCTGLTTSLDLPHCCTLFNTGRALTGQFPGPVAASWWISPAMDGVRLKIIQCIVHIFRYWKKHVCVYVCTDICICWLTYHLAMHLINLFIYKSWKYMWCARWTHAS